MVTPKFFAIVSFPRAGTHLLESALNSHSKINCLWEPFNETITSCDYTARDFIDAQRLRKSLGVTLHWLHARSCYTDIWDIVVAEQWPVIALHRANLLEQYVSLRIAEKTNIWVSHKSDIEISTIVIDLDDLNMWMIEMRKQLASRDEWLRHLPDSLTVSYESICTGFDVVQRYLGVRKENLKARIKKQGISMENTIENYEEVERFMSGLKHA